MKIYCLEFASIDGAAERLWHANRRALERYSDTLEHSSTRVYGIKSFDMPWPLTESRVAAFLNDHCREIPTATADRGASESQGQRGPESIPAH